LRVEQLYHETNPAAPFAAASVLAVLALVTLALKTGLEWKTAREYEKGQADAGVTTETGVPGAAAGHSAS
jgi:sulfate/thiosulfate transport system permease protein